jgi:hypothetical protein
MKITFDKNSFLNNLLSPVSKLSDNLVLEFQNNAGSNWEAKTLVSSSDNQTILMGKMACTVNEPFQCVIPDCKTFLRLFSGIEENQITLNFDTNSIKYSNGPFSFKYHLLDESYIFNKKSVSEAKLNALTYDTEFIITKQKFSEIIKFNSIIPDAEKLYFLTKDSGVLFKISDEAKCNMNEIIAQASSSFEGESLSGSFPINIKNILLFTFNAEEILIKINQSLKVFQFETPHLSYIVSGLVK